ncbi:MAG: ribbon-helix-helix protein, CopG family [Komarekiella atlantica HA4396-MV6]|jgi:predicted DNA-binding protein|nr:ribbon-helix-helix protein, CopG family [Komarekiella atlantica HA4396-MV6]
MIKADKRLDFRLPEQELKILEAYCSATHRSKTDVLRELIRGLKRKIPKSQIISSNSSNQDYF